MTCRSTSLKAALLAGVLLSACAASVRAETTVTFAGWGGVTQDAVLEKLFAGADKLGIKIRGERSGA